MGMVVQHNISAQNANEAMRKNVSGLKKSTEKLSTGYQINRAADNAAGLAISEKMRSQIRGLTQATANSNDAISLIQTAEGGLQETEDIMQRMRELAVQSANGTYTDEDREQIQYEVDALKAEVDRISQATEFNEMKLLDGSLDGASGAAGVYGAKYGTVVTTTGATSANGTFQPGTTISANRENITITVTTAASGKGGENAAWSTDGKTLTFNLVEGRTYTQSEIDDLIKKASTSKSSQVDIPDVQIKLGNGVTGAASAGSTVKTVAGIRSSSSVMDLGKLSADAQTTTGNVGYADQIKFTSNSYGTDTRTFKMIFDKAVGKEEVKVATADSNDYQKNGTYEIHLATGTEYSEEDIQKLLAKEGLDYEVSLTDADGPDGDYKLYANQNSTITFQMDKGTKGAGVGKEFMETTGEGLTFQIGANGVEDQRLTVNIANMSSTALGINNISVATQDGANDAINKIDDAIKAVSTQRAKLGAVQNRLEHTVNSLNTANENLSSAESQIRDTDMATEMIKYTKSNILQQASQSMLAQANQQPQGVLQLLG